MLSKKILFPAVLFLYLASIAYANELRLIKQHLVPTPENLVIHSASGIFDNTNFIIAYYAGQTPYEHGSVAKSTQCIHITRGTPNNWKNSQIVATPSEVDMANGACFDPVICKINNKIYLFYKIGHSPRDWQGFLKISENGGESWSNPIKLPENILGPAKCKPLVSIDGKNLICGASTQKENKSVESKQDGWVTVDILKNFEDEDSIKNQESWENGLKLAFEFNGAGSVVVQPALWQDKENQQTLHMLCRSNTGNLVYANSIDFGKTWKDVSNSELPSNYAAIDICKTSNNRIFMAWNPLQKGRYKLAISELVGQNPMLKTSWEEEALILEHDENKNEEYSFPSIIPCYNKLFVAYGANRNKLILAEVSLS